MSDTNKLRNIVAAYLSSGDADKFILEFSEASYGIRNGGAPDVVAFVNMIEAKIADVHAECMSKKDLREFIGMLVNPFIAANISVAVTHLDQK